MVGRGGICPESLRGSGGRDRGLRGSLRVELSEATTGDEVEVARVVEALEAGGHDGSLRWW